MLLLSIPQNIPSINAVYFEEHPDVVQKFRFVITDYVAGYINTLGQLFQCSSSLCSPNTIATLSGQLMDGYVSLVTISKIFKAEII